MTQNPRGNPREPSFWRFPLPSIEQNFYFVQFAVCPQNLLPLRHKSKKTGYPNKNTLALSEIFDTERMIFLIPCTNKCVYQSNGLCMLQSADAAGMPSPDGTCARFILHREAPLGSPHRYCAPGSDAFPEVLSDVPCGSAESDIV